MGGIGGVDALYIFLVIFVEGVVVWVGGVWPLVWVQRGCLGLGPPTPLFSQKIYIRKKKVEGGGGDWGHVNGSQVWPHNPLNKDRAHDA